jgi:tRNA threonylcarbamoyladenosine biosynthesis protein TsaB
MPLDPCLISLDTATDVVHLALCQGGRVWVRAESGGAQASSSTLPALQAMLDEAGLAWSDVTAIGFGQGPGAFTGLRTACAMAQGLALGLNVPVLPLDTLMAVAASAQRQSPELAQSLARALAEGADPTLWVLQDARMSEVYAAPYRWTGAGWQALAAPVLWSLAHWSERIASGALQRVCGSALNAYAEQAQALATHGALCVPQAVPDGWALVTLAQAGWAQGAAVDAALALPRYVRDKVAQTTAERQQATA